MNKQTLGAFLIVGITIGLGSYLAWWQTEQDYRKWQEEYDAYRKQTINNITIGDGSGEIHFHCPTSEFYIHIGNSTIVLREINGIIYVEGLKILDP